MNLMDLRLITIDSFTQCRFGGNPAAVVPECEEVPQMYYPQIANEINLSQSAFIHNREGGRFFIEFFTPTQEIKFSGHAAIGAFYVLSNMGYIRPIEEGTKRAELELKDGEILDVNIDYMDYEVEKIGIVMDNKYFKLENAGVDKSRIGQILRIEEDKLGDIHLGGYFNHDLIVFVKDKETLDMAKPDMFDLITLSEDLKASGLYLVYASVDGDKKFAYTRYFSPAIGFFEEAATGSAAASVGKILLDKIGGDHITIYQGQAMKRPSLIEIYREDGQIVMSGVGRIVTDSVMHL